jgi:hypothetical protein
MLIAPTAYISLMCRHYGLILTKTLLNNQVSQHLIHFTVYQRHAFILHYRSNITFFLSKLIKHLRSKVYMCLCFSPFFQGEIIIMFIKMEEPKDFVTWLQVAKVII